MERQQPITGEQSFQYAEKEIEKACGSLLTSHEGTIQVIHLTVKEFMMNVTSRTNNSYKQLLVDPAAASLQLSLVSLNYISQRLTTPIVDLDAKTNRMDLELDRVRLQDRLEQNPFMEYASFNWLLHSIDHTGDSGDEIATAIRTTFDSSATFYWIEACLLLDSSSFLHRIRLGLEDLIDWATGEKARAPPGSADLYQFLSNWCSVVICVVKVYGEGIEKLPWDVFILDMRKIFFSNGLGNLYNNHGSFETREPITFFHDDHSEISQDVSFHLQTKPVGHLTLFIYDHIRKVFFEATNWNDGTLFVQDSKTGRSLPPIVDPERVSRKIISYVMSKDGEYLGILDVDTEYKITRTIRISIWKLDSKIEFTIKTRCENWASKIFEEKSIWIGEASPAIVYRDDGYFHSPIGRIQPTTGDFLPLPPEISSNIDALNSVGGGMTLSLCFGAKGEVFVLKGKGKNTTLEMRSLQEPFVVKNCSPIEATTILDVKGSSTGRYLLLQSLLDDYKGGWLYSMYDTMSRETFAVYQENYGAIGFSHRAVCSGIFPSRRRHSTPCFEFSKDDCRLFCMALQEDPRRIRAVVFALNGKEPRTFSHGLFEFDGQNELETALEHGVVIDVCSDENTAWIAEDGRLYQMDLGPSKVKFPQDWLKDFQREHFRISSDGTRLSVLHYGDSKAQIQTFNLNTPGKPVRCLDLDWPHCESYDLPIAFSKDLSVLLCGKNLFHLAAEDRLASKSFPVFSLGPGSKFSQILYMGRYDYEPTDGIHIFISDENPSTAYIAFFVDEVDQGLSIYKVDMSSRCSAQVDISGIDTLYAAMLHPSLPLMLLVHDELHLGKRIISTLDLRNMNVKCLQISPRYRQNLQRYPDECTW